MRMSSLIKNEINTKASKNPLANNRTQLNSDLEQIKSENNTKSEQIKKLEEMAQKQFDNRENLIRENANKRAVYNANKKTTDLKRDFLSSIINNQKISNESLDKIHLKIQEDLNKNPQIFANIFNLNECKNQLLSKKCIQ